MIATMQPLVGFPLFAPGLLARHVSELLINPHPLSGSQVLDQYASSDSDYVRLRMLS